MSASTKRDSACRSFLSGCALVHEGRYREALIELRSAEQAFRSLDAGGLPLVHGLSNGVSGLANTLERSGYCHQKLGNYQAALTCYETSFINSKIENRKAFDRFITGFADDMVVCYERTLDNSGSRMREDLPGRDPEIDISFLFPFSLSPDLIPVARLYELAPERYARFKDFHQRAKEKDSRTRMHSKTSDDSVMKRMSVSVWGILFTIWTAYGLMVTYALLRNK